MVKSSLSTFLRGPVGGCLLANFYRHLASRLLEFHSLAVLANKNSQQDSMYTSLLRSLARASLPAQRNRDPNGTCPAPAQVGNWMGRCGNAGDLTLCWGLRRKAVNGRGAAYIPKREPLFFVSAFRACAFSLEGFLARNRLRGFRKWALASEAGTPGASGVQVAPRQTACPRCRRHPRRGHG